MVVSFSSVFTISVLLLAPRDIQRSALASPVLLVGASCLLLLQGRNEAVTWWPGDALALFWFSVMFGKFLLQRLFSGNGSR